MIDTTKQEVLQSLRRCEIFLGLSDDDLEKIAALPSVRMKTFEAGVCISKEGEPAWNLCILVEGKIDLRMGIQLDLAGPSEEITVDTVTKGSIFHWSALVPPYLLSRSSFSVTKSKVLAINGKELLGLMDTNPRIGYEIMQSIAAVIASRLKFPNNYFWAQSLKNRVIQPDPD